MIEKSDKSIPNLRVRAKHSFKVLVLSLPFLFMVQFIYHTPTVLKPETKQLFSQKYTSQNFDDWYKLMYESLIFPSILIPFISGYFSDKFGVRSMLTLLTFAIIIGSMIQTIGIQMISFPSLYVGRAIVAIGSFTTFVLQCILLNKYFGFQQLALIMGFLLCSMNIGSLAANFIGTDMARKQSVLTCYWFGTILCSVFSMMNLAALGTDAQCDKEIKENTSAKSNEEDDEESHYILGKDMSFCSESEFIDNDSKSPINSENLKVLQNPLRIQKSPNTHNTGGGTISNNNKSPRTFISTRNELSPNPAKGGDCSDYTHFFNESDFDHMGFTTNFHPNPKLSQKPALEPIYWKMSFAVALILAGTISFDSFLSTNISNRKNFLTKINGNLMQSDILPVSFTMSLLFFSPIIGSLINNLGNRPAIMISGAIMAFGSHIAHAFLKPHMFINICYGFGYTSLLLATLSSITIKVKPENLGKAFGIVFSLQNLFIFMISQMDAMFYGKIKYQHGSELVLGFLALIGLILSILVSNFDKREGEMLASNNPVALLSFEEFVQDFEKSQKSNNQSDISLGVNTKVVSKQQKSPQEGQFLFGNANDSWNQPQEIQQQKYFANQETPKDSDQSGGRSQKRLFTFSNQMV